MNRVIIDTLKLGFAYIPRLFELRLALLGSDVPILCDGSIWSGWLNCG